MTLMWALSDGCRAVFGTVAPYALQYTLGLPPQLVPLIIFFYILTSTATLPLWFALSRRIDKAPAWRLALRCNALCFVPVLVAIHPAFIRLPEASVRIPFGCIFAGVVGACGGGTTCLALSLMGDVIDADSVSSGQSHHGLYFALWAFVSKTAGGLVTIVTGFSLELESFVPGNLPWPLRTSHDLACSWAASCPTWRRTCSRARRSGCCSPCRPLSASTSPPTWSAGES